MINNIGKIHGSSINGRSSIKIDSSNVDITGNLITKGKLTFTKPDEEIVSLSSSNGILNRFNNVVNIPATDSDGNDLSANTTYEITTGPVGNINNISFKTGKHHGSMTFMPGTSITARAIVRENVSGRAAAVNFDTNLMYYTTDTEFEPVYGMAAKYTPVGVTVHTDQMVDTNGNNVSFSGGHPSRFRIARSGYYRLVVNLTVQDKSSKYRQNLMVFRRSGSNTANGYRVGTTSVLIGVQIQFNSSEEEVKQLIFNDICALSEGDEVYPCFHMNENGVDALYIDMNTYFNIEEI